MVHSVKQKRPYYVVLRGRRPGIYKNLIQALRQVAWPPYRYMKRIEGLVAARNYFSLHQESAEETYYYVVKRGRNPGIYRARAEALAQIRDFPSGQMKQVKGLAQARAYLKEQEIKEAVASIYIDGSYMQDRSFSGYGFVVLDQGKLITKDSGVILDHDIIKLQSLGAECYALIRAIEWALVNHYKQVEIIYDSQSMRQLISESEQLGSDHPAKLNKLLRLYSSYQKYLTLRFIHKDDLDDLQAYHKVAHDLSRSMSDIIHRL